ncbi:DNA-binding protein [Kitasatospora sp. NPDC094028]
MIGELSLGSAIFRTLWAGHHVHEKTFGLKRFGHPAVGELTLEYETFQAPGAPHHLLVVYTAPPGSPAEEALDVLRSTAPSAADRPQPRPWWRQAAGPCSSPAGAAVSADRTARSKARSTT